MTNQRILLVEDEQHLLEVIQLNLELEGFEVVTAEKGKEAVKAFSEQAFDLIVLDVMLPEIDGFTLCEQFRLNNEHIPIMFLTAKGTSKDKVEGLKRGADDYLTKPFNLEEFLLRIKVLAKRSKHNSVQVEEQSTYEFGGNHLNFVTYEAKGQHGDFNLTKKEVALLKLLIERKNQVVSRQDILQFVWGYDVFPSTRTIDNFILNFRKQFEENPKKPQFFQSVRGVGYRFVVA